MYYSILSIFNPSGWLTFNFGHPFCKPHNWWEKKLWRHSMTTLQNNCSFFQSKYLTCNVCLLSYLITMYCRIPLHISLNKTSKACHFEGFICEFSHISSRNFDNHATHGCFDFLIEIPSLMDNGHVMRVFF